MQNSLYDAQYGHGGGANVEIETRSGTAEFHGNAYNFGRNEELDANNFFANVTGVPREEFRGSQPGATFGKSSSSPATASLQTTEAARDRCSHHSTSCSGSGSRAFCRKRKIRSQIRRRGGSMRGRPWVLARFTAKGVGGSISTPLPHATFRTGSLEKVSHG